MDHTLCKCAKAQNYSLSAKCDEEESLKREGNKDPREKDTTVSRVSVLEFKKMLFKNARAVKTYSP